MGKPVAPCGTVAAYRRHLRHSEEPCEACRAANREKPRAERGARQPSARIIELVPAPPPEMTRLEELREQREILRSILDDPECSARDAAAVSRELRAVWAEIAELDRGADHGVGGDSLEQLAGGLSVIPIN